jgi:anti-anti-sigma factor
VERFSIRTIDTGPRSLITAAGEIDLAVADRLWAELDPQITAGRAVVLDCSGVGFLDSTGLRTLMKAAHKAVEVGATFGLAEPTPAVLRVLDLSGVAEVFAVDRDAVDDQVGRS